MTLTIFRYVSLKVIWYLPASTKMHLVYINCIHIINDMLCFPDEHKKLLIIINANGPNCTCTSTIKIQYTQ